MPNREVEILTEVHRYVNRIKVCLAFRDIPGIWIEINNLSNYLVSIEVDTKQKLPKKIKGAL